MNCVHVRKTKFVIIMKLCASNRMVNWKVEIISELDVKESEILLGIKLTQVLQTPVGCSHHARVAQVAQL